MDGIDRMCTSLRIQKYRRDRETAYLYQYVPRNFEQLFEKERMQDIEVGETVQITATLGILAVIDRNVLLTGELQKVRAVREPAYGGAVFPEGIRPGNLPAKRQ